MKIALVLLNYNDYKTTEKFIEFSKEYNSIDNIIVVDNNSTDNSFELLKKFSSSKISVIKSDSNKGYACGNNIGVRYAKEHLNPDYIIISNPDVFFEEKVISEMVSVLQSNKDLAMVSPKIKNNGNANTPIAWKSPDYFTSICNMSIILNKLFKNRNYYSSDYFKGKISYVDVIPGSFFMIKTKEFFGIGLLDENTFLYCEENILAKRLQSRNYKSAIINDCEYFHEHSASIDKTFNSRIAKYNLLYKSLKYYNEHYLNTGKFKDFLFLLVWKISNLEKLVLSAFKK